MEGNKKQDNKKLKKIERKIKKDLKKQYDGVDDFEPVEVYRDYINDTIHMFNNFKLLSENS